MKLVRRPRLGPANESEKRTTNSGKTPTLIVWMICLILYAVALTAHFGWARVPAQADEWSWILGLGLLLVARRVRGFSFYELQRLKCGPFPLST